MLPEADRFRLQHMQEAAGEALKHIEGRSRQDLADDSQLRQAIIYCLLVLGEAANAASPEVRALHPALPWSLMVRTRNRLIHGYFDISLDRIWDTLTQNLPPVLSKLNDILAQDEQHPWAHKSP
jgi:uncharacterized protein with HEPN domain